MVISVTSIKNSRYVKAVDCGLIPKQGIFYKSGCRPLCCCYEVTDEQSFLEGVQKYGIVYENIDDWSIREVDDELQFRTLEIKKYYERKMLCLSEYKDMGVVKD